MGYLFSHDIGEEGACFDLLEGGRGHEEILARCRGGGRMRFWTCDFPIFF